LQTKIYNAADKSGFMDMGPVKGDIPDDRAVSSRINDEEMLKSAFPGEEPVISVIKPTDL
jgi:hypothetical protein